MYINITSLIHNTIRFKCNTIYIGVCIYKSHIYTRDIGILKSIGVQNSSIKKIFFMIGFIIGTSATVFGVMIGTLFSIYIENIRNFISEIFNITLFPEEIYFLSKMPSEIDPQSIILISFCSIISTVIVSIFPATQAAKLDAVKTLKYE